MEASEKKAVLEKTLELLGPDGENWIQGTFWAKRNEATGEHEYLPVNKRHTANAWCLAGAVCEATLRLELPFDAALGYEFARGGAIAEELTEEISLARLADEKGFPTVPDFNDDESTEFEDIQKLVNNRIKQLEEEGI